MKCRHYQLPGKCGESASIPPSSTSCLWLVLERLVAENGDGDGEVESILYAMVHLDGRCAVAGGPCVAALFVSSVDHVIKRTSHNALLRIRQASPWKLRNPPRHPQHHSDKAYISSPKTLIGIADLRSHLPGCCLFGGSEASETACDPIFSVTI